MLGGVTASAHPARAERLYMHGPMQHGVLQRNRFERIGDNLADGDVSIASLREASELVEDQHPRKPEYLVELGVSLLQRFGIDLSVSVKHLTSRPPS